MKKTYKIGEFARNLGVSTGFLKHHENYGLLKPYIAESGYRYYELAQANQAFQCVRLQSMGFTSKEISSILGNSMDMDVNGLFHEKTEEIRKKLIFYQEVLSYMEELEQNTQCDDEPQENWSIGKPEPFYYMENVSHSQFEGNEKRYEIAERWNDYMPMVEICSRFACIGSQASPASVGEWHMGLRISQSVGDRLNIYRNEEVRLINLKKSLIYRYSGSRRRESKQQLQQQMLESPLEICRKHGFVLAGDIYLQQTFASNAGPETYARETVLIPIEG